MLLGSFFHASSLSPKPSAAKARRHWRPLGIVALLSAPALLQAQLTGPATKPSPVLSQTPLASRPAPATTRSVTTGRPRRLTKAALSSAAAAPAVSLTVTTLSGAATTSAALGTPVRLTAIVSPAVTGIVNFCDTRYALCAGPGLLGSGSVQASGSVTMPLALSTGAHNIQAVYVANTAHGGAASAISPLTVGNFSLVSLSSAGNAGNYSLTATNSYFGAASATPQPTGTIDIQDASNAARFLASASLGASSAGGSYYANSQSGTLPVAGPVGAVTADFNEDGFADTAVAVTGGPTLVVVKGSYTGPTSYSTWTAPGFPKPTALAGGDFDGDGHVDLVVAAGNIVVYLKGDGTGGFTPVEQITLPGSANVSAMAVTDFNADGLLDLVLTESVSGNVYVYTQTQPGTFPSQLYGSAYVGDAPGSLAVADLNADGLQDIVVSNYGSSSFTVLLNTGGGYQLASYSVSGTAGPLVLGDFGNLGVPSLAIVTNDGSGLPLSVFANDGTGAMTFYMGLGTPNGEAIPNVPIILTDGNNDGIPDLTFVGATGDSITWFGPGSGAWQGYASPSPISAPTMLAAGSPPYLGAAGVFMINDGGDVGYAARVNGWSQTNTFDGVSVVGTGTHNIVANYAGDANFVGYGSEPVSLTAQPLASTTTVTSTPSPSQYGQQVNLTVSVTATGGADTQGHAAGGMMTFTAAGKTYGPVAVTNGIASVSATDLPQGSSTITATYSGDTNFAASTGTSTQVVQSPVYLNLFDVPTQTSSGTQLTTLSATGLFHGSGYPTAPILFQVDGGPTYGSGCSAYTQSGICQINYPSASLTAGNHAITISYGGDATYPAASTTGTLEVLDGTTTLAISVPGVTAAVGSASVQLSANVQIPAQVPGTAGQVYFQVDGGTPVTAGCSLTSGNAATCTASYPTAGLVSGYHSIAFVVPADGHYIQSAGGNVLLLK